MIESIKSFKIDSVIKIVLLGFLIEFFFYLGSNFIIIGVIIFLGSFYFLKPGQIIYLLVFLMPNQRLLVLEGNSTSILNLGFVYLLIKFFSSSKKSLYPKLLSVFTLLLVIYGVLLLFINQSFIELVLIIKLVIVLFVMFEEFYNAPIEKVENAIVYFLFGVFSLALLSTLFTSSNNIERFDGGEFNEPNYIGTICSFGLALLVVLSQKIKFNTVMIILMSTIITIIGLLTQSRSFVLSLTLILIVLLGINIKKRMIYVIFSFSCLIIFFSSYLIRLYKNNGTLQAISSRIFEPKQDDVSGGRLGLWAEYFNVITSNDKSLFFGIGSDAMEKLNFEQVAHNAILEDLVTFGLFGILLIYIVLFLIYKTMVGQNKSLLSMFPLLIFFLNNMTLHSFLGMGGLVTFYIGIIMIYFYNFKRV